VSNCRARGLNDPQRKSKRRRAVGSEAQRLTRSKADANGLFHARRWRVTQNETENRYAIGIAF